MSRRYFDVNGDPIYTPSLNQSNYDFSQPDDSYDGPLEFYRSWQNNDDILLSRDQFNDNEINYSSNVNAPMQSIVPHLQNIPHEARITEAETQIHTNPENQVRRTYHLFEITTMEEKKIGRRKRDRTYPDNAEHTKFDPDNILTKVKKTSYNNYLEYYNEELKKTEDKEIEKEKIELKKITNSVLGVSSREDNLALLEMSMQDILSNPLSNNFTRIDKNYNKNSINFILERNDEKLTSLLGKPFGHVIKVFAGDLKDKDFEGFKTIEDEIKEIEDKIRDNPSLENEEKEYIKVYRYYAKNYKQTFLDKDKRAPRKKKND
jgi:hypothetical protein